MNSAQITAFSSKKVYGVLSAGTSDLSAYGSQSSTYISYNYGTSGGYIYLEADGPSKGCSNYNVTW